MKTYRTEEELLELFESGKLNNIVGEEYERLSKILSEKQDAIEFEDEYLS